MCVSVCEWVRQPPRPLHSLRYQLARSPSVMWNSNGGNGDCEQEQLRIISAAFSRKMLQCPIKGALTVTDGKAAGAAHTPLNHTRLCLL